MTQSSIQDPASISLPRKFLVAVDGSEESLAAARYAVELSGRMSGELSVLHVILIPEYISEDVSARLKKDMRTKGEQAIMKVRQVANGKNIHLHEKILTTSKSVVTTICEFATSNGMELIIVGRGGAGGVAKMMLGTVAVGVAREARCPVLLVG